MRDPTAAAGMPSAPRAKHKRKLTNYLLDRKLQLRYVLIVTIVSSIIAGALGFMIYHQERAASESIERDLVILVGQDRTPDGVTAHIARSLDSGDQALVYKMIAAGAALVLILSCYLVTMTHKVAGALFKVSMYLDRMASGRLGDITPLRRGDMLQDLFGKFEAMHEAVRARAAADVAQLERAIAELRAFQGTTDQPHIELTQELGALDDHVVARRQQLA